MKAKHIFSWIAVLALAAFCIGLSWIWSHPRESGVGENSLESEEPFTEHDESDRIEPQEQSSEDASPKQPEQDGEPASFLQGVASSLAAQMSTTQDVPFTSQAPSGQWSDEVFQNACEESSIIMAQAWITGKPLPDKASVENTIRAISQLADKKFGAGTFDTSAEDTAALFREYFPDTKDKLSVRHQVSLNDLRQAIVSGRVVIVPVDGRRLNNPNFTPPGPEYHMLLVTGYDPTLKKFITNDPGTRRGEKYRYSEDTLFNAMRDYPTGHHEKVTTQDKVMIVVEK